VPDALGRARVLDTAGQPVGHAELALDLGQQQSPAIRGQSAALEINVHGLAGNG
jgi:hypothetical protein